ncbi:uncharacterized protein B0H18DRAFT_1021343 [Fomitopsis serialis]|uniref:uncharacterized protein n=1 Tax=Fomitopsis serialis TaxID=139415 RepID=UPI0020087E12|nr:uncharacterized protein B0H18DRAFT_1021343 [Neoantrodia serialis]KAH9921302.1 hypothetical protein B0H18DRAFT_1021343 [Neoantrodia serialis]
MTYDDGGGQEEEGQEEESRELTREEVWDDSALVDAWNSAMAEYEAYHGKGKWKEEPVKKSPLWYNIPPAKPDEKSKGKEKASAGTSITRPVLPNGVTYAYQEVEDDSATHDLEANVPVHDPSFSGANVVPRSDDAAYALSEPGAMVSQDEAFSRALNASYWSGYWTAAYHYHRAGGKRGNAEEEVGEEQEDELLPAQR